MFLFPRRLLCSGSSCAEKKSIAGRRQLGEPQVGIIKSQKLMAALPCSYATNVTIHEIQGHTHSFPFDG